MDKLGHAHFYGGPDMAVATVSRLLGAPIYGYIRVNSAGVADIIDLRGGVTIDVEKDMHYVDADQNLTIDLHKGTQVLSGEQAVGYLRYRSDGSDITRIGRQQKFLAALKDQVFSLGTVAKLPALLGQIISCVDTNLTAGQMLSFARLAAGLGSATLKTGTLPGEGQDIDDPGRPVLNYWVLDEDGTRQMVDELVWGIDPAANAEVAVEVKNGTPVAGLAERLAGELRRQGYQVVSVSDTPADPNHGTKNTVLYERAPDETQLHRLSQAVLRYAPGTVLAKAKPAAGRAPFTIVCGDDYAAYVASAGGTEKQ